MRRQAQSSHPTSSLATPGNFKSADVTSPDLAAPSPWMTIRPPESEGDTDALTGCPFGSSNPWRTGREETMVKKALAVITAVAIAIQGVAFAQSKVTKM